MKKIIGYGIAVCAVLILAGCAGKTQPENTAPTVSPLVSPSPSQEVSEKSCQKDLDCACGKHKSTGQCFVGNAKYVEVSDQCPDFCSGIDGKLKTKCVGGECKQTRD